MAAVDVWPALEQSIASRRDQVIELIQELVRRPSFEGEGEVQAFISGWWRERGIEPDLWEPDIGQAARPSGFCGRRL